jgi:hypothetical protein
MKIRMKMQISSGIAADRSAPAPHFTGSLAKLEGGTERKF